MTVSIPLVGAPGSLAEFKQREGRNRTIDAAVERPDGGTGANGKELHQEDGVFHAEIQSALVIGKNPSRPNRDFRKGQVLFPESADIVDNPLLVLGYSSVG